MNFCSLFWRILTMFWRICNPPVLNISIWTPPAPEHRQERKNAIKQELRDYKSLYSTLPDCKSGRTETT